MLNTLIVLHAQMRLTLLAPHPRHSGFLVEVNLSHNHNHLTSVAEALRFRPLSEDVKHRYFDLFKQGYSPSSAYLEHESNLMYCEKPHLLADQNANPMFIICSINGGKPTLE